MTATVRSALFVPASRPDRFEKALAAGADAVIIDLEDAVEHDVKDTARQHVSDFAKAHPQTSFLVRVNGATTPWFADRSEEHTSELQSLMRISYAVCCLKTKIKP